MQLTPQQFVQKLLAWYDQNGRKDLPWRQQITAYRVWISEIMLQQTQVKTVIPYFQRFLTRFPDIATLANAHEDEVLYLWTGLGYYSRARNLHKAAQQIMQQHEGKFPNTLAEIQNLPGIGLSTAGAIFAIAFEMQATILDGNVKRVLTRLHAIGGWPGETIINQKLWQIAKKYTPDLRVGDYTQAIMDLGATICIRAKPKCELCPFINDCVAKQQHQVNTYPTRKPTKLLPVRRTQMLLLVNQDGEVYMEKRPPVGIWGGLWGFPECPDGDEIVTWCEQRFHCQIINYERYRSFRHTFSHFHLDITPVHVQIRRWPKQVMDSNTAIWYKLDQPLKFGVAKPVQYLLAMLRTPAHA